MHETTCERVAYRPRNARQREATAGALLHATHAVVLAGGRGTRLHELTDRRPKPAMPFAGKLKIIDFTLSNCINSGIRRVSLLTQYKAQSLIRHMARGWNFLDAGLGEFIDLVPAQQQTGDGWYCGTANAVFQNLEMLQEASPQYVLVLAGDHVYKMDYGRMLAEHVARDADASVACIDVPLEQASSFGVVQVDDQCRVVGFDEKPVRPLAMPGRPDAALASMGIYVFKASFLYRALARDAADPDSCHDFARDIIPAALSRARVFAHDFADSCVNTIDAYWEANMDLTRHRPELNLYDDAWPIRSQQHQLPPARFVCGSDGYSGTLMDSLVSSGCIASGAAIRRSLLFCKACVGEGSVVEDSLLLPDVVVGRDVVLRRAIIDKHCVLPDGIKIGVHPGEDRSRFRVTDKGVTLVTPEMLGQCVPPWG
jgi:glucose-1-phosphate adenylyltransferase